MEKYAGFWIRWVAFVIDSIVLSVVSFIIGAIIGMTIHTPSTSLSMGLNAVTILISFVYYVYMTYSKGATLGKMAVGIVVKSTDLSPLGLDKVILREVVGKLLSSITLGIGYIMIAFTGKKQGLHDMVGQTVVVYKDPNKKMGVGLIIGIILAALLPFVAIIGILSSVVLVSLNTARSKADDAMTKSYLTQIAVQLENYSLKNGTYSKANNCNSGAFTESAIQSILSTMKNKDITCYAADKSYAISAKLKKAPSFCVDSAGVNKELAAASSDGVVANCSPSNLP